MIIGIGLDITEISRIEKAYTRKNTFSDRVLTDKESAIFSQLTGKRQMEFLAGRYAAKEAYSKAVGTGIGKLGFKDIEILPDKLGKPVVTKSTFDGNVFLSITHTDSIAAAQVVLERRV
ncbi:holo-[acyl-carrier protein] synthase [Desemzia incerta]|uniref:Holo-[acyl-carrier-protein] synthase n=1 Tax=Desemzia incerta TaxID=82801 RepID=A0A1I5YSA1_9LACT|nr:holo-ACP synthase [Desemzia incerta]SFQ47123.1 holo-[acyl-carrier protein] synthase [Desemzia incerta]